MNKRICWCGDHDFLAFSSEYERCANCGTLVSLVGLSDEELQVSNDETDFYGRQYWLEHQSKDLGFPNIFQRSRSDLTDRNLHWLRTLLKYRLPPAKVLELGCSHGSFVGLLHQSGYEAAGLEMSPWVVDFAHKAFGVPISVGPIENLDIEPGSLDVVALMDVLEHLPDPVGTMEHTVRLLKPDGLLLIQTPQFKNEMNYEELVATNGAFLEQFKSDEHLYLFTKESVSRLFKQLGAEYIVFEPPMFYQYDMFFVVSRQPIVAISDEAAEAALASTPSGRFALALLDLDSRIKLIDADRAERLDQINALSKQIDALSTQIATIDADRADRLDQINILTRMVHELRTNMQQKNN